MGIAPTGKPVTMAGMDLVRLAGGRIVERWGQEDMLGLLQQLGAAPPPGPTAG
jgi:predicted ester cyclase